MYAKENGLTAVSNNIMLVRYERFYCAEPFKLKMRLNLMVLERGFLLTPEPDGMR
jgi:hypothetical protein